jgi:hypothetical protein
LFANLVSSVMLRAVVGLSGSASFQRFGPSVVSVDFDRMSQCTSRPRTTTSSWSFESLSTAFFSAAVSRVSGSSVKCVWPAAMTPNGLAVASAVTCRAVRTNVASSNPNASSSAVRMAAGCLPGRGEDQVSAVREAADLVEAEPCQDLPGGGHRHRPPTHVHRTKKRHEPRHS